MVANILAAFLYIGVTETETERCHVNQPKLTLLQVSSVFFFHDMPLFYFILLKFLPWIQAALWRGFHFRNELHNGIDTQKQQYTQFFAVHQNKS